MNNFIITILYLALGSCFALSAPIKVHQDLERPPYPEAVKLPDNIAFKLALLLDEGKLEEFYQAAFRELEKIDDESEKDADKKRSQSQLWLFYYIAGAPFFQMDAQPDHMISWSRSRLLDYLTKISAVRYMAYFNPDTSDQDTVISNSLCADYCARIIKDMRLSYIPNLDAKQQKEEKEFLGKTRELLNNKKLDFPQLQRRDQLFHYKASTVSKRNDMASNNMELLEEDFVTMLLRNFSGNAAKIKKYIKQAGYANKEIQPLLNRTAGRSPTTEFLYK